MDLDIPPKKDVIVIDDDDDTDDDIPMQKSMQVLQSAEDELKRIPGYHHWRGALLVRRFGHLRVGGPWLKRGLVALLGIEWSAFQKEVITFHEFAELLHPHVLSRHFMRLVQCQQAWKSPQDYWSLDRRMSESFYVGVPLVMRLDVQAPSVSTVAYTIEAHKYVVWCVSTKDDATQETYLVPKSRFKPGGRMGVSLADFLRDVVEDRKDRLAVHRLRAQGAGALYDETPGRITPQVAATRIQNPFVVCFSFGIPGDEAPRRLV